MMSHFNKEIFDHGLDSDDCSLHCPGWFPLFLASLGLLGLIGCGLSG